MTVILQEETLEKSWIILFHIWDPQGVLKAIYTIIKPYNFKLYDSQQKIQ